MAVNKLPEFAKNGQKNTDGLTLEDGFPVNLKPARQWFNFLFNTLALAINQIIDEKLDKTANAVSATKLQNKRKIYGQDFDGTSDLSANISFDKVTSTLLTPIQILGGGGGSARGINIGDLLVSNSYADYTKVPANGGYVKGQLTVDGGVLGNAATATKLATVRTIGGVNFDGSANINLPGVNTAGNQNTSGNAASATTAAACTGNSATASKLQTARTIGGVNFDGSANINLPGVNTAGNQNTSGNAATATKLATARNITLSGAVSGSVSFDGSGNVSIPTTPNQGVGIGQTWQDIKASRYSGVVYTNNTGNTITVIITASGSNNTALTHQVNGVQFINTNESLARTTTYHVPNGASYMCAANIILNWVELR